MIDEFRTEGYQRHNRCRQEHLASLGLDLEGKTVLELGAGIGDHTGFWLERGCEVTCVEARADNLERLKFRYPSVAVCHHDLDGALWRHGYRDWDIVYAYGILYHLRDPRHALWQWAGLFRDLLLLETCVYAGTDGCLIELPEPAENDTASYRGWACRPSRRWVRRQLRSHMPFVYVPKTQPAHEEFPTDWEPIERDGGEKPEGLIRAVFIGSRRKLDNPLLTDELPMRQERFQP